MPTLTHSDHTLNQNHIIESQLIVELFRTELKVRALGPSEDVKSDVLVAGVSLILHVH